jgi:hypothetical protein
MMYTLLRQLSYRALILQQLPTLAGSLFIAEILYKFGSFTLESIAFLATWFVLDLAYQTVQNAVEDARQPVEAR